MIDAVTECDNADENYDGEETLDMGEKGMR